MGRGTAGASVLIVVFVRWGLTFEADAKDEEEDVLKDHAKHAIYLKSRRSDAQWTLMSLFMRMEMRRTLTREKPGKPARPSNNTLTGRHLETCIRHLRRARSVVKSGSFLLQAFAEGVSLKIAF